MQVGRESSGSSRLNGLANPTKKKKGLAKEGRKQILIQESAFISEEQRIS